MSTNNKNFFSSTKVHIPALLLSTLFLVVLLAHNTFQNWKEEVQRQHQEAQQTTDNFVQQSTLLAQASYRTNRIVTVNNNTLIQQSIEDPSSLEELTHVIKNSIFNYTGFFIFSSHGDVLLTNGGDIAATETTNIWTNISSSNAREGLFLLRYADTGGFYFYTRFSTPNYDNLYFVSRRAFSSLSSIIYKGDFHSYELLLIDNRDQSISMRKGHYIESNNQPPLSEHDLERLIYRTPIPTTFWDVAAVSLDNPQKIWPLIKQPTYVLATYFIINILFWSLFHYQRKKTRFFRKKQSLQAHFANQVLNSSRDIIIATDANGRIQYANQQAKLLFSKLGFSSFYKQELNRLVTLPDALWNLELSNLELQENKSPHTYALEIVVDNETTTYEQSCTLLYNDNKLSNYVWLLHDITAEVDHAKNASLNEERYRALFNEAGVGHCILDISRINEDIVILVDSNQTAVRMTEAPSKQEFLTKLHKLAIGEKGVLRNELRSALKNGLAKSEFELPIKTFKGNIRHLWVSANLAANLDKESHIIASFTDITDQVNSHQMLKEREHFWKNVMDAIPNVIYIAEPHPDKFFSPVYFNRSLTELLGLPSSTKSIWFDQIVAEDHEKIKKIVSGINRLKPQEVIEVSARFHHADGSIRIIKFRNTPFLFEDNKVTQYIGIARDITEEYEQQEAVLESERRYRLLTENISDIIWTTDIHLNFNFVSPSVRKVLGYAPSELVDGDLLKIFKKRDILDVTKRLHRSIQAVNKEVNGYTSSHKVIIQKDLRAYKKDGSEILLEIQASPLWNDSKELIGIIGISRDVTVARQIDDELKLSAEVFAHTNEAIIITDRYLNVVKFNPAFFHITGYDSEQLIGKKPKFLVTPEQYNADFIGSIQSTLERDGYWQGEINYIHSDGTTRTAWSGISAMTNRENEVQRLIIVLSDITERKNIEANIHRLAYFDSLTGLANRSQLNEHLNKTLAQTKKSGEAFALLFIDLDRFKPINDTMGHPAGDQVLQEVAKRLSGSVKRSDLVCRMGGDEFTIALTPQPDAATAADVAFYVGQRILKRVSRPYFIDKQEVFLSGSIGIAIYPQDGSSATELLKNADMAMYHAKDLGRDNVQFYQLSMNERAKVQLEIENDLRHALERNELELYFQSQHAAQSEVATAAEALLRWNHPVKGLMLPNQFIPILEDSGLIVSIGKWVLEQACHQFAQWHAQGLGLQRVAVNVSARQFHKKDFVNMVRETIESTGIKPHHLELELTESILIQDVTQTLNNLNALRAMGVRIAIDDFGTGYSSLNYLKQFPVDTLKIDRIFIQNLPTNKDDAQITRTIIAMAHNLGMGVIAEGVEKIEQLTFLRSTQCEEIQGFYFSKPMPGHLLLEHLQKNNAE